MKLNLTKFKLKLSNLKPMLLNINLGLSKNILIAISITLAISLWMINGLLFNTPNKPIPLKSKLSIQIKTKEMKAKLYTPIMDIAGKIKSEQSIMLTSQVEATVDKILVKSGDTVQKGTLLMVLSGAPAKASLNQAYANYNSAKIKFTADKKLHKLELLSKSGFQQAKSSFAITNFNLQLANKIYKRHYIKSPFNGHIGIIRVKKNENVIKGLALFDLENKSSYNFEGFVSTNQRKKLKNGLNFTGVTSPENKIEGYITAISSTPEKQTNTYRIEGKLDDNNFISGESASISVKLEPVYAHSISPSLLTLNNNGDLSVRVVENGIVVLKVVEILSDNLDNLWVLGLNKKTTLITDGAGFAIEGKPLK